MIGLVRDSHVPFVMISWMLLGGGEGGRGEGGEGGGEGGAACGQWHTQGPLDLHTVWRKLHWAQHSRKMHRSYVLCPKITIPTSMLQPTSLCPHLTSHLLHGLRHGHAGQRQRHA